MKLEFASAAGNNPARFFVGEQYMEKFTQYLKAKNVCVHNILSDLTDGDGDYFSLDVQMGIPPQDGNSLVSEFLKTI